MIRRPAVVWLPPPACWPPAPARPLPPFSYSVPQQPALQARGHEVREQDMTSGLQAIQRTQGGFFGGADPPRGGVVLGD